MAKDEGPTTPVGLEESGSLPSGATGTSKEAHLARAAELLNRNGPADRGFRLRGAEVAEVVGLSRSALYKLWPSMVDLAEDARHFAATEYPDWRRTLTSLPPERPLSTNLARALAADPVFITLAVRTLYATFPDGELRREVAAAEEAWFEDFGRWLSAHLSSVGLALRPGYVGRDLAIAITAAAEGAVTLVSMSAGRRRPFWLEQDDAALSSVVDRLIEGMTEPMPPGGAGPPAADPSLAPTPGAPASRWSERQRTVLTKVLASIDRPLDDPTTPFSVRLVDLAALARHLKVSRRRLEQLWPAPSDLNGDLFSFQARRLRATSEHLAGEVLMERLSDGAGLTRDALVTVMEAVIRSGVTGDGPGLFSVAFAVGDPHLSKVAESEFVDWRRHQQVQFFAIVHAFGYQLKPGVEMHSLTTAVFSVVIGAMRVAMLNPHLLDVQVGPPGQRQPVPVAAALAVFGTFTTDGSGEEYPARDSTVVQGPPSSHEGRSAQDPPPILE